jgi:hypothetical protein
MLAVIIGRLTHVSADVEREQRGSGQPPQAYYTVRIALPAEEVARLDDMRLVPGMPVEVFILDAGAQPAAVSAQIAAGADRTDVPQAMNAAISPRSELRLR